MICTELRFPVVLGSSCGYIDSLSVHERTFMGDLVEHCDSPRTSRMSEFRVSRLEAQTSPATLAVVFFTVAATFLFELVVPP